jgi:lipoic acid synthetase
MVGFGETKEEVIKTISDIKKVNCNILTIGQYLKPLNSNLEVKEYVHPNIFEYYKREAKRNGIKHIFSGPLIRSSYNASKLISV